MPKLGQLSLPECGTFYVVGRSGSGKSVGCSKLLDKCYAHIKERYVINDPHNDWKSKNFLPLSWQELNSKKDSVILLEDVLHPGDSSSTKSNAHKIEQAINFSARHNNNIIIIIIHSFSGLGHRKYIPLLSLIFLCKDPANITSIKILKSVFELEEKEIQDQIEYLKDTSIERGYIVFEPKTQKFFHYDANLEEIKSSNLEMPGDSYNIRYQELIDLITPLGKNVVTFASYILPRLNNKAISSDFQLRLKNAQNKKINVSLPDLFYYINNNTRPPKDVVSATKYLNKRVNIPKLYVKNDFLKRKMYINEKSAKKVKKK